jgi:hypothetical protein
MLSALSALQAYMAANARALSSEWPAAEVPGSQPHHPTSGSRRPFGAGVSRLPGASNAHAPGVQKRLG